MRGGRWLKFCMTFPHDRILHEMRSIEIEQASLRGERDAADHARRVQINRRLSALDSRWNMLFMRFSKAMSSLANSTHH
jgi:hypothetical protein